MSILKEPDGFSAEWKPFNGANEWAGNLPVEGVRIGLPWYEGRTELTTRAACDGVAVAVELEQAVVLMAIGGSPDGSILKMCQAEDTSGNVLAMTPERAVSLAVQLINMARKAQDLRE